ncbi:hypothetical protein BDV93DRAFT_537562 [Ceratobasidium sp. AG-I]|nr:hypothetical protein BDV93DRAFT_537562 [Ceratobasidium sp. AG-I]
MVGEQPIANRISINSAEQDDCIESVTIFQANRAEVKRRVKLNLKRGQNHVDIERLPSCVNEDSIRVDGTGTAIILDVVYHNQPAPHTNTYNDERVSERRRALEALRKERDVAKEQAGFLGAYGKTLDSKNISIEHVERFLDMFGPRQVAVAKRIQELDIQIAQADKEYQDAQSNVYADARGAKRRTKITVTVLAEADGEAELMVTYVVTNASWTPLYDVRATIAKSPEEPSTVSLHYRASITQTTGEHWPDVALTLSTASPQVGSEVPNLSAWRIAIPAPPPRRQLASKSARRNSKLSRDLDTKEEEREESDDDMGFGLFDGGELMFETSAPAMAVRQAQVVSAGVLSATFGISGRSDIPSDQGSHKVVIAVLDLQAELEWICVPREKESVYLRCKVVNSSEFTLLPGEASVFMDDNFVSKSRIEHVAPNDSFKTSLGTDPALRVSYPPVRTLKRTTTQSGFAFLAKDTRQSVAVHSQRITVRNARPSSVSALRVLDHVPVSTDSRLKVTVLSPNGLGPGKNKERPWVNVQKGVKGRWAALDVGGEGTIEWMCEIAPTEEVELELSWEVSAPVGEKWENVEQGRNVQDSNFGLFD